MRITPVIFNFAVSNYKNNQNTDYSQYRVPVLKADTCSFKANEFNKIYSSNARNAVSSLASLGVTCLCCGKKMIDMAEISRMDAEGFFKGQSKDILKRLNDFESYMKPLERRVYHLLLKLQEQYPEKNLPKLLETKKQDIEAKLIKKQVNVFTKISNYCVKYLPGHKVDDLNLILENSYNDIYGNSKTSFSRKKFIGLIYKFTRDLDAKHQKKLLAIAEKLPTSQNLIEAFIIKYSRKNNREITMRLIQNSIGTIEHIKPRAEGGPDHIYNYAIECAEDNWARSCKPMIEQIQKHPDMPQNAQKQIDQIIDLVNEGKSKVDIEYVRQLKDALYRASGGIIDLDISRLKPDLPRKEIF